MNRDMTTWTSIENVTLFQSPFVKITKENFRLPGGRTTGDYIIAEKKDYVVIVPVCERRVLFLRQYRPGIRETILNLPMGFIEKGEHPEEAAVRELREESGLSSEKTVFLGKFALAPGFCTFFAHIFYCQINPKRNDCGDKKNNDQDYLEGNLAKVWIPTRDIRKAIKTSRIFDASSVLALCLSDRLLSR